MALIVTINGVDALDHLELGEGNPAIDAALQARTVARLALQDRAGAWRPTVRQPLAIELDGVRIFGGVLSFIGETDFGDYKGNRFTVDGADWTSVIETIPFNGVTPASAAAGATLRDVVQDLIDRRLASRGFFLDPAQLPGPVIGAQGYSFAYVSDVFDTLATISGWPWTVDAFQRVLFAPVDPVARPAPFTLRADNDTIHSCETQIGTDGYVNAVWLHYGAPGPREVTETWVGTGAARAFTVQDFPQPEGILSGPPTLVVGGVTQTVGAYGDPAGSAQWYWRAADATLLQDAAQPTVGAGVAIVGVYVANFPAAVLASNVPEVAAYGEFAIVATDTSIYDVRQARQLAEGLLSERGGLRRRLLITTFRPGLEPGQVVWVDVPERNVLNQPCLLLTSRLVYAGRKADGGDHWRFDLELIEGDYGETWQKFFRTLTTVASGVAVSAGGGVGPPPSPGGGGSGGGGSGGAGLTFAGGSRSLAVSGATAWTPICEFVDVLLPAAAAGATTLTVRCHAWLARAAGTIQVRVLALEATNVVVGTSTPGSALAWSDAAAFKEFPVTLRPTPQYYRVEAQLTDGTNEGFVAGVVLYPGGV